MKRPLIYAAMFLFGLAGAMFYSAHGIITPQKGYTQAEAEAIGALSMAAMAQVPEASPSFIRSKLYYDRVPEYDTVIQITPVVEAPKECTKVGRVRMEDGQCWLPELWRKLVIP